MNYLIVDDEPISHQIIDGYAADLPFLTKLGGCYNAIEALAVTAEQRVDLLFLDIRMPRLTGYDFLRSLKQAPQVVVMSAHPEYALEGYDLDICDYLLKPFDFERFLRAVNKARARVGGAPEPATGPERHETLFLKDGKRHHQVAIDDILYLEAQGNYCMVHLLEGKILAGEKISELTARLPGAFVRIHKSFVVAARRITVIEAEEVVLGDRRLPVGRVYKPNIARLLGP